MFEIDLRTDFNEFQEYILQAETAIRDASKRGFHEAMEQFFDDVRDAPPSCPVLTGDLYDAHTMEIIEGLGGFRGSITVEGIRYAPYVHEGICRWGAIVNWTRPGSGSHWISSKHRLYKDRYRGIIKKALRRIFRWRR